MTTRARAAAIRSARFARVVSHHVVAVGTASVASRLTRSQLSSLVQRQMPVHSTRHARPSAAVCPVAVPHCANTVVVDVCCVDGLGQAPHARQLAVLHANASPGVTPVAAPVSCVATRADWLLVRLLDVLLVNVRLNGRLGARNGPFPNGIVTMMGRWNTSTRTHPMAQKPSLSCPLLALPQGLKLSSIALVDHSVALLCCLLFVS